MKGPMTTQSLRGLANHGPMHWRGDRTGAGPHGPSAQPDTGAFDEEAAFNAFNAAFMALNGRDAPIPDADMQAFTDFALQILVARAMLGECELVAKVRLSDRERGFLFRTASGRVISDDSAWPPLRDLALRLLAAATGRELTYTCAPTGSGRRMGLDADLDGHLDGDEDRAGSDPRDPSSVP
jgi:hypothetical protein